MELLYKYLGFCTLHLFENSLSITLFNDDKPINK